MPFYSKKISAKNYSKIIFSASKLIRFQPNRPPGNFSVFSKKISFFCLFLLLFCLSFCCSDFAEELPGMCAKLLPLFPSCPEISLALLLSFSQSAHERMNDLFLLFLL